MLRSGQSCSMPRLSAYRNVLFHEIIFQQHCIPSTLFNGHGAYEDLCCVRFLFYFNPLSNCFTQHFFSLNVESQI